MNSDDVRDIVEAGNEANAVQLEASSEEELNDEVAICTHEGNFREINSHVINSYSINFS